MDGLIFDGWDHVRRTLVIGVLAYLALVALLRLSGKRTLSKMNAFDFVVTVALGSTLATILLDSGVSLVEGVTALALLVALQFVVTWTSVRWPWLKRAVTGEPTLLLHRGRLLGDAMRRARVTEEEIRAAARQAGSGALTEIDAVVLETDGTISVVATAREEGRVRLPGLRVDPPA
ncbi:DUF421 domain-containing protein [Luteimonas deserti]|uniref:DUF421 domain-containing protein n=1 Tax=Luteimonas deserti TaxID=2752306 RepID=A0A7Z0QR65_9GAMM|nr:YetF domain-containing protein [Luteimonas deserti]NYZ63208.1 DUF421 domain-containing protein [Luteimonas deserti]